MNFSKKNKDCNRALSGQLLKEFDQLPGGNSTAVPRIGSQPDMLRSDGSLYHSGI